MSDVCSDISPFTTVCQLIDSSSGTENCTTICNEWVFDEDFNRVLPLSKEILDIVCKEKLKSVLGFKRVHYTIRAISPVSMHIRMIN